MKNKASMSKVSEHIEAGTLELEEDSIILGKELSISLGAFTGDYVRITTPGLKKARSLKVAAISNSGMYEYDLNVAYVRLDTAQEIFGMGDSVSGIGIDTDNIYKAAGIKDHLSGILSPSCYIRTWMDLNKNLFSALKLEKWAMFVILTLIVIVAALNIISTLSVMVTQKAKDIGILKAIGATRRSIAILFAMLGSIIGLVGITAGVFLGAGISFLIKRYNFIQLPKDIYYISSLPVRLDITDSVIIAVSALAISLIASLYPAIQASRLQPADTLRYE
jgi:lipoprotein-releasing system permease protein